MKLIRLGTKKWKFAYFFRGNMDTYTRNAAAETSARWLKDMPGEWRRSADRWHVQVAERNFPILKPKRS